MSTIIEDVRAACQINRDDDYFDPSLFPFINETFAILFQLGIGPDSGFRLEDVGQTWEEYVGNNPEQMGLIPAYVGDRVRLKFDPPISSAALNSLTAAVREEEWRISITATSRSGNGDKKHEC